MLGWQALRQESQRVEVSCTGRLAIWIATDAKVTTIERTERRENNAAPY